MEPKGIGGSCGQQKEWYNEKWKQSQEGLIMAKVQRWGNSLGVRIPQELAPKYGLVNGSHVRFIEDGNRIILQPVEDEFTLEELLA